MRLEILIAGTGGQGILVLGHILGKALAKYTNYYVLASEAYAAETRGGDSRADLIVADRGEEADFIKVSSADIAIFMHQLQLDAYKDLVKDNAIVFIDKTNVTSVPQRNWKTYLEPYTEIAEKVIGDRRVANIVALGHVIKVTNLVPPEAVEEIIKEVIPRQLIDLNIRAFRYYLSKP